MPEEKDIYHIYAPQDETADTEASRAIKDALGRKIDETYATTDAIKEYVRSFASINDFPETGEENVIYIAKDTEYIYRWNLQQYVQIAVQDLSNYYTKAEAAALMDEKDATVIANEVEARNQAISTAINNEVIARDAAISTAITNEVEARNQAIAVETARATNAENQISNKLTKYFDKFVGGENIDAQFTEGQLVYCYKGSVIEGGDVPSTTIIRFTQTSNKALYLKRIYIKYVTANNEEVEYEYIFTSKMFTANNQTVELNGINWLLKDNNNITYFTYNTKYGQQIGSGTVGIRNCTISTTNLAGCTVKEIQVSACGATSTNCKLSIEVGNDTWLYDEGGAQQSTEISIPANDSTVAMAFTHGEGSTPGTATTITYEDTFLIKHDDEIITVEADEKVIYVNLNDRRIYMLQNNTLVEISKVLELGNTSTTAYRGDYGNQNYQNISNILYGDTAFEGNKTFTSIKSDQTPTDVDDLTNKEYVDSASAKMVEITWANLKALRDDGNLVPGMQYRITDYECTTIQGNTSSANHQFDIIVLALEKNKLSEEAGAAHHAGDTYFASSNLSVWKLWYCLDNDRTRFAWADTTNGKGVVYRMIDEFGNDVPYDFKNILFTKDSVYTNAYTFSYTYTYSEEIKDASILSQMVCRYNIIKKYFDGAQQALNFNVFYSNNESFFCRNNIFDINCSNNTFSRSCSYNIFGYSCGYNTFSEGCQYNTFGADCNRNTFGDDCAYNIFGYKCSYNTLDNECYGNILGYYCSYTTFNYECSDNTIGHNCSYNIFGDRCSSNMLGNYCLYNTFGANCSYNIFGNFCLYNTFGDSSSTISYCKNIIIDNGCSYLYINSTDTAASWSNQLQNVHVHLGVTGSSSVNRLTITVPDRALAYEISYEMTGSMTVTL